ncbi:hypothetical protein AB1N83_014257, partial [Pleurotus pulmonarius]
LRPSLFAYRPLSNPPSHRLYPSFCRFLDTPASHPSRINQLPPSFHPSHVLCAPVPVRCSSPLVYPPQQPNHRLATSSLPPRYLLPPLPSSYLLPLQDQLVA